MLSNPWEYWEIMRGIVKFSTKLSIAGLFVLMGMSAGFANTLSEIQIDGTDSGYGIVLKTDEITKMKKTVSADNNKLTIQLKDVEVSEDLNTVYNDVTNFENVTVAPAGKSDIKIIFTGEGVANSKVYFENLKTTSAQVVAQGGESIELGAPVSSYTPVYNNNVVEEEIQDDQTSNTQINEILTGMHVSREMLINAKSIAKKAINKALSGDINLVTILGVIFIIASMMFRPKKKVQEQKQQSLSELLSKPKTSNRMEREIALNRAMANNMVLSRPDGLGAVNPVSAGYGIKAYQNSQKNPYTTNVEPSGISGIPRRKPLPSAPAAQKSRPQIIRQSVAPIKTQPVVNKSVSPVPVATKPQLINNHRTPAVKSTPSDLDSVKFLESITKIYEKNGRTDLAKGLKENLRKAQVHSQKRAY